MELKKYWEKETNRSVRGEYWLSLRNGRRMETPDRAYISWDDGTGQRTLFVWEGCDWAPYCTAENLRALKAIGRLEAARRLHA